MIREQTPTCRSSPVWRSVSALACLVAAAVSIALLVRPFIHAAPPWQWAPQSEAALAGATVNAELVGVDDAGVMLDRQGRRSISLITPPLKLPAESNRVLVIQAARPEVMESELFATVVTLLWQTEPKEGVYFKSQTVLLNCEPKEIAFSLPAPPEQLYRLGVQFPDVRDMVQITSFALPRLSLGRRLPLAWQELNADEPVASHSINFIRGPQVLGHSFSYYLVSAVIGAAGCYSAFRLVRRRRVSPHVVLCIALLLWVLADGQATHNLARQAGIEEEEFRGKGWLDQIELVNGPEIAWAYSRLLEQSPPGSTFAVVSGDPFTPSHRLAYLLAPQRTLRESYDQADFVLVLRAERAAFEDVSGMFRWGEGPWLAVEKIAELSPEVYLLRKVKP
jgi:hypothetical protein